jgi:hypothetical protein
MMPAGAVGRMRHGAAFPEMATIDHLDSRLSSDRRQHHDGQPRTVLACYACNQRRSVEEQHTKLKGKTDVPSEGD